MPSTNELGERWLRDVAIELATEWPHGPTPDPEGFRIHIGGAPGTRGSKKHLGWYCPSAMARDGIPTIFISPRPDDPIVVAGILAHEMAHHSDHLQGKRGHGPSFGAIARALGLAGPLTATTVGPDLAGRLNSIIAAIGPYPHAAIDPDARKKQDTRMIKYQCPRCAAIFRCSRSTPRPLCDGGDAHEPTACETEGTDTDNDQV